MKKTINFVILLMMAVLLLAACGQTTTDQTPPSSTGSLHGALEDSIFDDPTEPSSNPSPSTPSESATQPSSTPATQPTTPSSVPTQPSTPPTDETKPMDYLTFQAMSGAEQRAYQESFESLDAFFEWYNTVKEAYEKENPPIEIGGDGAVDWEDIIGGKG